jgi:serine/threonine-protein kinase
MMGRNDVPKSAERDMESPAHEVSVKDFFMDRTEVTNAEYADFVHRTGYQAPKNWAGNNPPTGRERWPVTEVSADDARGFAAWRSTRDGVKYRLPTEEEWEYAARGGSRNFLYPWGNTWHDNYANLGTGGGEKVDFPRPVGSYPQGASASGILDMIGNVWEWTSSEASLYPGNHGSISADERGNLVIRGGSHQSLHLRAIQYRGSREFPATFRVWSPGYTRENSIGFRLVREGK